MMSSGEVEYSHVLGALSALGSAFCWALAAILFRRVGSSVSALGLNLAKGLIAFCCLGILLMTTEYVPVNLQSGVVLALSGLVGICLGDTLYFVVLVRLGPRLTLLLGSLIPVVVALMAFLFLQERIGITSLFWLLLTISGVGYVLWERAPQGQNQPRWKSGVMLGLLFVVAEAAAIMLTKVGVQDVPSVEATFIRQTAAIMGLSVWGLAAGSLLGWLRPLEDSSLRNKVFVASIIGAFLGTWLSVLALKYTYASVAAALNSTSPLFALPLAAWMMREAISRRVMFGSLVAVAGVAGYFFTLSSL